MKSMAEQMESLFGEDRKGYKTEGLIVWGKCGRRANCCPRLKPVPKARGIIFAGIQHH